ncbi:MAG: CBS domain-containing protein, partial [Myxococcota bacterium]|nr:CBS domain-containing protein [Myxococcota bacterium]
MAETAESVMERAVITVSPETSLLDVHRLFAEEQIHGAPVVDDREVVVGVVTASDLIRAVAEEHDSATGEARYFRDLVEFSGPDWGAGAEDFQDRLAQ